MSERLVKKLGVEEKRLLEGYARAVEENPIDDTIMVAYNTYTRMLKDSKYNPMELLKYENRIFWARRSNSNI